MALMAGVGLAHAQAQPEDVKPDSPAAQPTKSESAANLQRVEITGSRIRRVDAEAPLPVQVIQAEELRQTGKTSVTEVLQALSINGNNGVTDNQSFNNFAYGASGVSLRGLGPTATLVLINGRRVAPYSVPDINKGLTSFVNVDSIPLGAIQRIEILKDGASAIYGSDAMAGVINIILRKDYRGNEVEVNAQSNQHGQFGSRWANLMMGRGDLDRDGWNWMMTLDAYQRDQVMLRDVKNQVIDPLNRDSPFYYTGRPNNNRFTPTPNYYGTVFFDDGTGAAFSPTRTGRPSPNCPADKRWAFNSQVSSTLNLCGYSYWDDAAQYVSPIDRQSLFSRGEMVLGGGVNLFGEVGLTRLTNKQRDWPTPFGSGLGATPDGRDGGVSYLPQYLPAGHPNNPFPNQPAGITYLFQDVGMQGIDVRNNTARLLGGARGTVRNMDWEVGLLHAQDETQVTYLNRVSLPVLRDAVLNGTYNFENPGSGRITANDLRVNPVDKGKASFTTLDAKITGEVMQLPAGPLGFAAGTELRHESRYYNPDDRIYAGEVYLQVAGRNQGSRNVATAFTEFSIPITQSLLSQAALRTDHYSDYGSSTTPKLALAWKAMDNLKLRSSYTKGFRAPSLNESNNSDTPQFSYVNFDSKRCGTYNVDCDGYAVSGVVRANNALKPETSDSFSAGFVLEPARDMSLSFDFWNFDRRNEIVVLSQDEVLANEDSSDPLFAGRVRRLPVDNFSINGTSIPGRITSVEQQFVNRGRSQVRGVDLDARWRVRPGFGGPVDLSANFSYTDRYRVQPSEGDDWVVLTGTFNNPRVRGNLSAKWQYENWTIGGKINYLSGFKATLANQDCVGTRYLGICNISEDITMDLFGSWAPSKQLTVRGTIRNVTDSRMPVTPTVPTGNRYWYSAQGRAFSLSAAYSF